MKHIIPLILIPIILTSCYNAHTGMHVDGNYVKSSFSNPSAHNVVYREVIDIFSEYSGDTLMTSQICLEEDMVSHQKRGYMLLPLRDKETKPTKRVVRIDHKEMANMLEGLSYLAEYEKIKPMANLSQCNYTLSNGTVFSVQFSNHRVKNTWVFCISLPEKNGEMFTKHYKMEDIQYLKNSIAEARKVIEDFIGR